VDGGWEKKVRGGGRTGKKTARKEGQLKMEAGSWQVGLAKLHPHGSSHAPATATLRVSDHEDNESRVTHPNNQIR
jgi:hypothetical protein